MQATSFFEAPPANRVPAPRPVTLRSSAAPIGYRPAPFKPLTLGQPPVPPKLDPSLSKEEMVRLAVKLMKESGQTIAAQLARIYNEYKDLPSWWLAESVASFFVAGPAGPVGVALDTWWQSSRANQAVAKLNAVRALSQAWLNSMRDEWIPQFLPFIDEVDPTLYDPVSNVFDRVVAEQSKVMNIIGGYKELPPRVAAEAVSIFLGSIRRYMTSTSDLLLKILEALSALTGALAEGIVDWPYIALGLILVGGAIWLLR